MGMRTVMRWGALFFLTTSVYAACEEMARVHWKLDTQLKKVEVLSISQKVEKFCGPLVEDSAANLLLSFQAGSKSFQRRLLVPLEVVHEQLKKNELSPTLLAEKDIYLDSPIPLWARSAPMKITELATGKLLGTGVKR
jgi:hypothetical protein